MPAIHQKPHGRAAASVLILVLASLVLAACGGSSVSTSSGTSVADANAPGTTSTSAGAPRGRPNPQRFQALRECLAKNGIKLPPGGAPRTPGGGVFAGPRRLPSGVTRAQMEAALKKCGAPGGGLRRRRPLNSAARAQRMKAFAACMQSHGVKLPAPNTSGQGPVFDTKGLDTQGAQFKAALSKCSSQLLPPGTPGAQARPG
jgi:hypothetical protein